jgi:hypothetical protein
METNSRWEPEHAVIAPKLFDRFAERFGMISTGKAPPQYLPGLLNSPARRIVELPGQRCYSRSAPVRVGQRRLRSIFGRFSHSSFQPVTARQQIKTVAGFEFQERPKAAFTFSGL